MSGWLHEDYELMGGPTVQGILADFRENTTAEEQAGVVADIQKFLTEFGSSNESLRQAMERIFYPCFVVEGWEGLTTHQWLREVEKVLQP